MPSLVITIIALALFAALTLAGMNYVDGDVGSRSQTRMLAMTGFTQLGNAFISYREDEGAAPPTSNWQSALFPTYGNEPTAPTNLSYSYGRDGSGGHWFCLSGSASEAQYQGLSSLSNTLSPSAYFIGSSCGITTDGAAPSTFPATVAATYWVVRI